MFVLHFIPCGLATFLVHDPGGLYSSRTQVTPCNETSIRTQNSCHRPVGTTKPGMVEKFENAPSQLSGIIIRPPRAVASAYLALVISRPHCYGASISESRMVNELTNGSGIEVSDRQAFIELFGSVIFLSMNFVN